MVSRLERMQSAVLWDGNGFWRRPTFKVGTMKVLNEEDMKEDMKVQAG